MKNDRWGSADARVRPGTTTRFTLGYYKLKQDNISDYGIPWIPVTNNALAQYRDQPAPVPRNTFYGFGDRDREVLNQDTGTVKFERDFAESIQLRTQLRFGQAGRNSMATPPRLAGNDSTTINRELRSWVAKDRIWDNQTDLRTQFQTFGIRHTLVTGAAFTHEQNTRINRTGRIRPPHCSTPTPTTSTPAPSSPARSWAISPATPSRMGVRYRQAWAPLGGHWRIALGAIHGGWREHGSRSCESERQDGQPARGLIYKPCRAAAFTLRTAPR